MQINKSKIKNDLLWNYISLFFLGLSGLGINICIGLFFDPSTLGAFNQIVVTYLLIAILGSGGINFSVLRALAQNHDKKIIKDIVKGALIPSFFLAIFFTIIYFNSIGFISNLFVSENVRKGMVVVTPAIFFFSINKVLLLGIINGMGRMRAFSIYQIIRYLGLIFSLLFYIRISLDGSNLPIIFNSEIFLFIILIVDVTYNYRWISSENWYEWSKDHLLFDLNHC